MPGVIIYMDVNTIVDPAAAWAALAYQDPYDTSVGMVAGHSAALIDPANDPTGTANGSVSLVEDGTWIVVEGNGQIPISDLEAIAASLKPFSARPGAL